MRILKFFTFLWTCSICSQVFSSKNEHQIHSQFRRYQRAANVPEPTTKLAKIVANHMKIARIANGIYIQKGLSERKFSKFDLIASIWNLKDKTTLKMLNEFPVDKLSTHLAGLKTVMEGISGLEDVKMDEIEQKLKPIKGLLTSIEDMKAAVAWTNIPSIVSDSLDLNKVKVYDKAETLLGTLKKIKNAIGKPNVTDFKSWVSSASLETPFFATDRSFTDVTNIDKFVNFNQGDRSLQPLIAGINATKKIVSNLTELAQTGSVFTESGTKLGKLEPLLALSTTSAEARQLISKVTEILEDVGFSEIAYAFTQERDIERMFADVKDKWVLDMLNNGQPFTKVESGFETLKQHSEHISGFSKSMKELRDQSVIDSLRMASKIITALQSTKPTNFSTFSALGSCFSTNIPTIPSSVSEIEQLSEELKQLVDPLTKLRAKVKKVSIEQKLLFSLADEFSGFQSQRITLLNATILDQSIDFFTNFLPQLADVNKTFSDNPILTQFESNPNRTMKIEEIKNWMKSTGLLDSSTCDLGSVNTSFLTEIGRLIEPVLAIKTNNGLEKFAALETGIAESIEALNKMKELQVPTVHFAAVDDLVLREVFIPIATLQQLTRVHENSLDLGGVVNSEPIIRAAISRVSNAQDQNNLTATWNAFSASVTALNKLSGKLIELEKKLKDPPETSLDGVTNTYETAKGMPLGGKINLRPYLLSFKLLDSSVEIQNIEKSFKEIDTPALVELDLAPAKFSKLTDSLNKLIGQVGTFSEKKDGAGPSSILLFVIIGILVVLIIVSLVTAFMIYRHCTKTAEFIPGKKYSMKIATGTGPAEQPFTSIIDGMELYMISFAKMQDVRLEINRKDPKTNSTKLYTAVMNKNWNLARELLAKGALVDVLGGPFQRTALHEMVLAIDFEHATWLLDKGAWIMQPDRTGDFPETWADSNGFHEMFNKYQHGRELRRLIPPFTPRTFNVLVINPYSMAVWRRRKLPERIKNKITWGYNYSKDVDLNAFTHIVVPKYYCSDTTTLDVGDDDLFPFKLVASWGMLLHESWLEDMINDPDAIDEDEFWYLTNMKYREKVYQDSLFKIKVDIHMGRPGFLYQARITILETKDEKRAKQKEEWEEIIEMFGGTNAKQVVGDVDENAMPYNTLYSWYNNHWEWQNGCWILKFEDSKIDPIWRSSHEIYTLVPFHFLPTAIAGYYIPNALNTEIPLDCIRNDNKKNNVKSERKKRPKSSRSETSLQPVGISKMAAVRKSSGAKSESSNSKKSETSKSKTTVSSS